MVVESDEILLSKWIAKRDRDAFAQLFSRHYSSVYRLALKLTHNPHHAEDVAQSTFISLAKVSQGDVRSVYNWLLVVAKHRVYRLMKREQSRYQKDAEYATRDVEKSNSPPVAEENLHGDLDKALSSLPVAQWFLLRLYFYNGLDLDETARALNTNRRTVVNRLDNGLERLRHYFRSHGLLAGIAILLLAGGQKARAGMATSTGSTCVKAGSLKAALVAGTCLVGIAGVVWIPPLVAGDSTVRISKSANVSVGLYDIIYDAFAPQLSGHPQGLPSRIASMSKSEYSYWLGSHDHFMRWVKAQCPYLMNTEQLNVVSSPVLNFNRMNLYPTMQGFGAMAFGSLDWQNSTYVNPTLDLIQQAIAVELWGREHGITLDSQDRLMLASRLTLGYQATMSRPYHDRVGLTSLASGGISTQRAMDDYQQMIDQLTEGGRLLRRRHVPVGDSTLMLDDDSVSWDQIAEELCSVVAHSPATSALLRIKNKSEVRAAIRDVAAASEVDPRYAGNHALVVWLHRPFKDSSLDGMIILRQSMNAASERQGSEVYDLRHPARRSVEHMRSLMENRPYFCNWCRIGGVSYTLELLEPWSRRRSLEPKTREDLLNVAEICGRFTGAIHRRAINGADASEFANSLSAESISDPSGKYIAGFARAFADFQSDPRTVLVVNQTDRRLTKVDNPMHP